MSKTDIMVVEDSGIVLLDIQKSLKSLGYSVVATASSKDEAIQKADETQPDLVLMDIRLGEEMGGIEAADHIREHYDIPIVFLTGYADEDTFQRAKITDPLGYILKPFDPKGLRTTIEIAIHNHGLKRQLRESEGRYRTLVETMNDGVAQVDAEGKFIFVNDKLCEMIGMTKEELIGQDHTVIFPKEKWELQQKELKNRMTGDANSFETVLTGKDGVSIPVILSGSPVFDSSGKFLSTIGVFTDITESKQAEQALRASETKYRKLFSEMSVGCALHEIVCDLDGDAIDYITLEVNAAYERIMGVKADDVVGGKASAALPESELKQWVGIFGPVALTGKSTHYELYSPLKDRYFEGGAYSPEAGKIAVTFSDVTDRKRFEEALQKSEERYRLVADFTYDWEFWVDPDGLVLYNSPSCEKISGYPAIDFKKLDDFKRIVLLGEEKMLDHILDSVPGNVHTSEFRIRTKSGEIKVIEHVCQAVYSQDGKYLGRRGSNRDITDRKQVEVALQESQALYHDLVENAQDLIWQCDSKGNYIYLNPAWKTVFGYTIDNMLGKSFTDFQSPENAERDQKEFELLMQGGSIQNYETIHQAKDGRELYLVFNAKAVYDQEGEIVGTRGTAYDVTERKRNEAALKKSEYLLRESHRLARIGHYDLDIASGYWESSESLNELFGIDWDYKTDVEGWLTMVHPDDKEMMTAYLFDEVLGKHQNFDKEYRIVRIDDGETRWVHGLGNLEFNENGNPKRMIGSIQDITERKQAEEKIRESESRLSAVIENTSDLSLSIDLNYRILTINEAGKSEFKNRLKVDVEIGQNMMELVPDNLKKKWKTRYDRAFKGERFIVEDENEYPDDEEYYSEVSFNPIWSGNEVVGVSVFSRNITDRKKAEFKLRASEERYRAVVENQTEFIVRWKPDGTRSFVNEAYLRYYDLSLEEALSTSFAPLILEEDRGFVKEKMTRLLSKEVQVETEVYRVIKPDGSIGWQEWTDRAIYDEQGKIVEFQSVGRDITEQKLAELARKESERRFREALLNVQLIAVTLDQDGKVTFCNDFLLELIGWTRDDLLGKNWFETCLPSDIGPALQKTFKESLEKGAIPAHFENEIQTRPGDRRLVIWNNTMLRDIQGRVIGATSIGEDITERKHAEEALLAKTNELEALFSISTHLRKAQSQLEMLPLVLEEMRRVLHSNANTVLLLDEDKEMFTFALADGSLMPNTGKKFPIEKSISGLIQNTGQSYKTIDFAADQNKTEFIVGSENLGPALLAPIHSEAEFLGVLLCAREKKNSNKEFTTSEMRLLTAIGEMVGNAMRRARLYDDALTRLQHVQALHSIDMAISANMDLNIILDVLIAQGLAQLDVDAACILLLDQSTHTLEFAAGSGFHTNAIESTRIRLGEGLPGEAVLGRQLVLIPDITNSSRMQRMFLRDEGYQTYQAAPLVSKGQLLGVLEAFCRRQVMPSEENVEFLETLATQAAIAIDNAQLFSHLQRSNFELELAYDATIEGWSRALELRDQETEGHTLRVTEMTLKLARAMGISGDDIIQIRRGALLHDIGKMGVSDSILLKEGKLDPEEWELMKKHSDYAFEMLWSVHFLRDSLDIPHFHHEKWDGTGYPRGLRGEEIPLSARIFTIADVWDALTSDRPYREAWTREKALEYIRENAGKHFDPQVVKQFLRLIENG